MSGRAIRMLTAGVVLAVAAFAAIVSYSHVYDLGRAHGQSGTAARLLPLSVDGLIAAASLVMLHEARRQRQAPPLARWMLALGIAATLAANVLYGLPWGPVGAVVSGWPAVAFVGAAEMLMYLVRSAADAPAPAPVTASATASVPSLRQIQTQMRVGQARAREIQALVKASMNGHNKEDHDPAQK